MVLEAVRSVSDVALFLDGRVQAPRLHEDCEVGPCFLRPGDCGDYWSLVGATVDVEGFRRGGKGPIIYRKGGTTFTLPRKGTSERYIR